MSMKAPATEFVITVKVHTVLPTSRSAVIEWAGSALASAINVQVPGRGRYRTKIAKVRVVRDAQTE